MPIFDFPEIPEGDVSTRKDEIDAQANEWSSPATSIKIIITGDPVPKGRPRARIINPRFKKPFIHFYQDSDTEAYEKLVAVQGKIAMQGRGMLIGALGVNVVAYVPIPRSWSAKQRLRALEGSMLPISRPDGDNYLKCACDALNGVCWKDDSQIVDMTVRKRYSSEPRLEIEIFAV